jgi:hypothetical protein
LNSEIADCWKLVWNVEPAALMVPLAVLELALDEALVVAEPVPLVEVEALEEHAARPRAVATTATPAVVTRCLRPSGISGTPYMLISFPRPHAQPPQPVRVQTVVCEYSLSASRILAGKC